MKKIAVVDIGTNSVLYSLFDISGSKIDRELYFERHSPRIGKKTPGRKKPVITSDSYDRLKRILSHNLRHAQKNGASEILIAATNPLRKAQNGREIKKRLESDLGCRIEILTPDEEAFFSFRAAFGKLRSNQTGVVIDLGGGSTELVVYRGDNRQALVSLPEGAVSLTERFGTEEKVSFEKFEDFEKFLSRYRQRALQIRPYLNHGKVRLVGGTSTALASFKEPDIIGKPEGVALTPAELDGYVSMLGRMSSACRRQLLEIDKKRTELIFAGAFWCKYLLKILEIRQAVATPWGLRHGMVIDLLQR